MWRCDGHLTSMITRPTRSGRREGTQVHGIITEPPDQPWAVHPRHFIMADKQHIYLLKPLLGFWLFIVEHIPKDPTLNKPFLDSMILHGR